MAHLNMESEQAIQMLRDAGLAVVEENGVYSASVVVGSKTVTLSFVGRHMFVDHVSLLVEWVDAAGRKESSVTHFGTFVEQGLGYFIKKIRKA